MNKREKDLMLVAKVKVQLSLLKITDRIKEHKLAKEAGIFTEPDKEE